MATSIIPASTLSKWDPNTGAYIKPDIASPSIMPAEEPTSTTPSVALPNIAQGIMDASKYFLEKTKVSEPVVPAASTSTSVGAPISQKYSSLNQMGTVTTPYGGKTRLEKFHPGLDVANDIGTPIPAFAPGVVVDAATGKKQGDAAYGNYVVIKDAQGNLHRYSHLSNEYVKVGDVVQKGQTLGAMGNTGQSYSTSGGTGSHLDYRIKTAANKYLNPNTFVNSYFKGA